MMRQQLLYLSFLCLLLPASLLAQEAATDKASVEASTERKSFDRQTWRKATRGLDYTVKKRRQKPRSEQQVQTSKNENSRTLFIILGVILLAMIVALLIAAFTGHLGPKNKSYKGTQVSVEAIEANIFERDLQHFIREALGAENYRRVIRLYFLETLKELAVQKKIKWKKEKTNRIYFYELQSSGLADEFERLALIFDRVRYGQAEIKSVDFDRVAPDFKAFLRKLNPDKVL